MERFKSIFIVFLIISALFLLTLNLGISPEKIFEDSNEESSRIFDNSVLFSDGILPEEIIINFSGNEHTVVHSTNIENLWEHSSEILIDIFGSEANGINYVGAIDDQYYYSYINEKSIILRFSSKINLSTILNSLNIGEYLDIVEEFNMIDSIFISIEDPLIIIDSNGEKTLIKIDYLSSSKLEESIDNIFIRGYRPYYIARERFGGRNLAYIPYSQGQSIEVVYFENILENLDNQYIENMVYEFFKKEINQLREIDDGEKVTYTDGEKTLQIGSDGLVTFFNPQLINSGDRNLYRSIESALEFISNNLGYDNSLYLKEIEEISHGSSPGFNFKMGKVSGDLRVLLNYNKLEEYVVMDVYNDQVRNFSQLLRRKADQGYNVYFQLEEDDDIKNVIEENLDKINNRLEKDLTLDEALENIEYGRIVYVDNVLRDRLSIGWDIIILGEEFYFNIY